MKKIIHICDRCRKEIREKAYRFMAEGFNVENGDYVGENPYPEMERLDFCKDCADYLDDLIRHHCKKASPAIINQEFEDAVQDMIATLQPECGTNPPPPADKPKRRLDGGKIRALRNAGWTVKAIAEEMNCSEQAVYNVLKKLDAPADKKKAPEPEPTEQSETN